jgi:hypothetical protein
MCGCRKKREVRNANGEIIVVSDDSPVVELPGNNVWGPLLWNILHIAAETMIVDKPRIGLKLDDTMDALKRIIPCAECKSHFSNYMRINKFNPPNSSSPTFKDYVRNWFFELHNSVNARLGKQLFDYNSLSSTYSQLSLNEYMDAFITVMGVFVTANVVRSSNIKTFRACISYITTA